MKRFISILLAVMLMASMVVSANAAGTPSLGVIDLLKQAIAATGDGDDPVAEDVYVVAGNAEGASGAPDTLFNAFWDGSYTGNQMTKNADGTYSKTFTAEKAYESVGLKVVKNGSTWIGDANGNNIQFAVTTAGDFTVTIDPTDNKITVTGNNVQFATSFEYESVYAVGQSVKTGFLNDIDWTPNAASNKMTETADDVWEITYQNVSPDNGMQVKFAIDGTWDRNFGIAKTDAPEVKSGVAFEAAWDGANIALPLTDADDDCDITLKLDLSNFDLATTSGAKITISWGEEEPATAAPVSEAVTDAPETQAPETQAPETQAPETQAPETQAPETQAPETEAPTDEPAVDGASTYYLVGSFNEWQTDEAYILTKNAEAEGEYFISGVELKKDDTFKIVETNGSILGFEPVWYPSGTDNDYTVTADGTYDIYFRPNYDGGEDWYYNCIYAADVTPEPETESVTDAPVTEAVTDAPETQAPETEAPTDEPAVVGASTYYLVGSFNEWQTDEAYILTKNAEAEGEYFISGVELKKDDTLKIVETNGSILGFEPVWYPSGTDNDYTVTADGTYDIYFRPNYDGGEDWYYNCIYAADVTPEPETEAVTDAPETEAVTDAPETEAVTDAPETQAPETEAVTDAPQPGSTKYYLIGTMTEWEIDDDYEMFRNTAAETFEYYLGTDFNANEAFKVVAFDGVNKTWYPDGEDNNYAIETAGEYTVYFRPNYDGGDDWFHNCIYAAALDEPGTEPATDEPGTEPATDEPTGEPVSEDTYVVAGNAEGASGAPDTLFNAFWDGSYAGNQMTKNADGTYSKTFTAEKAYESVGLKVVKNGTEWIGDANGNNIQFAVTGAGDFTVTIDPETNAITVTGDNVQFATSFEYESVYAVGNSVKTGFLNDIDWTPDAASNKMTETADDVWEITYHNVSPDNGMQVKFTIDGTWDRNFGTAKENAPAVESGVAFDAVWDGGNIALPLTDADDDCDITLKLDLSNFDLATTTGAKITVTISEPTEPSTEEPTDEPATQEATGEPATQEQTDEPAIVGASTYYLVGSFNEWQTDEAYILTKNAEAEGEYFISGVELKKDDTFKIVETNGSILGFEPVWYPDGEGNNYVVAADGTYDIYFRPNYDGGDDWFYNCIYAAAFDEPGTEPVTDEPGTEPVTDEPATVEPGTEPVAEDTYVVAGNAEGASGAPDTLFNAFWDGSYADNQMKKNADGTYSKTFTATKAYESVGLKVVKNGSTWIGDANGNNIQFAVTGAGDFTVTIDPETNAITVTGDNVQFATSFEYESVYAVGQSVKTGFLNDIDWTPDAASNKMTETADDVWEITYHNVSPDNGMQVKFTIDGTWDRNFGTAKENAPAVESGVAFDAVWDGGNIALPLTDADDDCDITLKLDLSNFDLATTTGAKITVTISEPTEPSTEEPTGEPSSEEPTGEPATDEPIVGAPEYYIVGTFNDWQIDENYKLEKNTAAEGEEYVFGFLGLTTTSQFKVVSFNASIQGGNQTWYPDGTDNNYGQNGEITAEGTYSVYFRPNGDGGDDWFYNVIYVTENSVEPGSEPATDEPTVEPVTDEPTEPPVIGAPEYYLIGEMTNWEINEAYKLAKNTEAEGEYFISGVLLFPGSMFKVVSYNASIQDGNMIWYPDGTGNAYGENGEIEAYGNYDIYFRPDGQGGDDWFYGVIYATLSEEQPEQPTAEPATEEPTGEQPTNAPAEGKSFYLIGNITDPVTGNRLDFDAPQADTSLLSNLKLQPVEGEEGLYKYENIVLRTDDSFKVVKTGKKGDAVSEWYPDGWDNNRTVPEDGIYTVWFRPAGDGTAEDGWEYIYYVGDGSSDDLNHAATRGGYMYKIEKTGEAPVEPGDEVVIGDVDGDGYCTIFDVTYIQKWLAGFPGYQHDLTPDQIKAGDVDGDGEVTINDATYIQRFLVGIEDKETAFYREEV